MSNQVKHWARMAFFFLLSVILMAGCQSTGNTGDSKGVTADTLKTRLLSDISYQTKFAPVPNEQITYLYELPENCKACVFMGNGSYADELAWFDVNSAADTDKVLASIDRHLSELKANFSTYIPEEVPKIEHAVTRQVGNTVFLCITADYENVLAMMDGKEVVHQPAATSVSITTADTGVPITIPSSEVTSTEEQTVTKEPETETETETEIETEPETEPETPEESVSGEETETGESGEEDSTEDYSSLEDIQLPTIPTTSQTEPPTEPPVETTTEPYVAPTEPGSGYLNGTAPVAGVDYSVHIQYQNVVLIGDMAYEYYDYDGGTGTNYANMINRYGEVFAGRANVYSILVPTAVGIVLPDAYKSMYDARGQDAAIMTMYNQMSARIHKVWTYDILRTHRYEYLYFRTNHHWTQLAAYYAYVAFCQEKGITPTRLEDHSSVLFTGFLGNLSSLCDKHPNLAANPDYVLAYNPVATNATMVFTDTNGNSHNYPIIADVSTYTPGNKYMCFTAGDQPYTVFTNPNINDGSVCIFVKDSFGCPFVPFLVDHYQTIYELDPRYYAGSINAIVSSCGTVPDIVFLNNVSTMRSNFLISKIAGIE